MSEGTDRFARAAPGVRSAESVREGDLLHLYHGELESETGTVRLLVLAPDVTEEAVHEAFTRVTGQWQNASTHPNVVTLLTREDAPRPWVAVKQVDGRPLDAVQAELSLPETRAVVDDVGEALRNANLYNTTHLALEPQHVWVQRTGDGVTALVDDWGLRRAVRVAAGESDVTPFTAPELLEDPTGGDERTDVYGLGALAYYALTGQPPVTGTDLAAAIRSGDVTPPSHVAESVPPAADDSVLQALATDPDERQDSAYQFKQAFTRAVDLGGPPTGGQGGEETGTEPSGDAAEARSEAEDRTDSEGTGTDENARRSSRRGLLQLVAAGVAGAGLASVGWLTLGRQYVGGTTQQLADDTAETQMRSSISEWLPAPSAVDREHAPFSFVDAANVREHASLIPREHSPPVYPFFEEMGSFTFEQYAVPFTAIDGALITPGRTTVVVGGFDAERLRAELERLGGTARQRGDFAVYGGQNSPVENRAFAVSGRQFVVGRQTVHSSAAEGVRAVVDAYRGEVARYVDAHDGAAALVEALKGSAYGIAHPRSGAETTNPARGLFESGRGAGLGVSFEGDRTELVKPRVFEGTVPRDGVETWADEGATVTFEDGTALARTTKPTTALTLRDLADFHPTETEGFDTVGVEETEDRYVVTARAFKFGFVGLSEKPVGTDKPVQFRLTSSDVLHGIDIQGTPVNQLLISGKLTTFTVDFERGDAFDVVCSRYCGVGHRVMEAELTAVGPGGQARYSYLSGVSNFDGTVKDATGMGKTTVLVGAEGNGSNFAFAPPAVKVDPGTTVVWEWTGKGGGHNVVAENGSFESTVTAESGYTFEYTFTETGVYRYYCAPHKALGMKGVVEVR